MASQATSRHRLVFKTIGLSYAVGAVLAVLFSSFAPSHHHLFDAAQFCGDVTREWAANWDASILVKNFDPELKNKYDSDAGRISEKFAVLKGLKGLTSFNSQAAQALPDGARMAIVKFDAEYDLDQVKIEFIAVERGERWYIRAVNIQSDHPEFVAKVRAHQRDEDLR
jgi:hypothetical protein